MPDNRIKLGIRLQNDGQLRLVHNYGFISDRTKFLIYWYLTQICFVVLSPKPQTQICTDIKILPNAILFMLWLITDKLEMLYIFLCTVCI